MLVGDVIRGSRQVGFVGWKFVYSLRGDHQRLTAQLADRAARPPSIWTASRDFLVPSASTMHVCHLADLAAG